MMMEVFSFDGNKTFGYDILFNNISILKMNKKITIKTLNKDSIAFLDKNNNLKADVIFLKNIQKLLFSQKYINKEISSNLFKKKINEINDLFKDAFLIDIFSKYSDLNNLYEEEIEMSEGERKLEFITKKSNQDKIFEDIMRPYLEKILFINR